MTDASTQNWDARRYAENARFVSDLGLPVVELLAPRPGERILDLGCGDGALTVKLVESGCAAVGVDAAPDMVAAARARGVDARVMGGGALEFANEFDAVFSNAALHWMPEPAAVIAGVRRALRPGGRFVGELGGHGNVQAIITALDAALAARGLGISCPWYFPRPEQYRALLEEAGFAVETMELFPRPTRLPGEVGAWLETFAQAWLAAVPAQDRPALLGEVAASLRPLLVDKHGDWIADYVRLRFRAVTGPRPPAP